MLYLFDNFDFNFDLLDCLLDKLDFDYLLDKLGFDYLLDKLDFDRLFDRLDFDSLFSFYLDYLNWGDLYD